MDDQDDPTRSAAKRKVSEMEDVVDLTASPRSTDDNQCGDTRDLKRARMDDINNYNYDNNDGYDAMEAEATKKDPPAVHVNNQDGDHNQQASPNIDAIRTANGAMSAIADTSDRSTMKVPPIHTSISATTTSTTHDDDNNNNARDPDGFVARELDTVDATPRNRTVDNANANIKTTNANMKPIMSESNTNGISGGDQNKDLSLMESLDPPTKQDEIVQKQEDSIRKSTATTININKTSAATSSSSSSPPTPRKSADRQIVESMFATQKRLPERMSEMKMDADYFVEPSSATHKRTSRRLNSNGSNGSATSHSETKKKKSVSNTDVITSMYELPTLNEKLTLDTLTPEELADLEAVLEITAEDGWREDWSGNLAFTEKEITNPKRTTRNTVPSSNAGSFRQALYTWAQQKTNNAAALKYLHNLFRYVYHLEGTPPMARTILANADRKDGESLEAAFRRVSYDPMVLRQDGWTTMKAPQPVGATGGAHRIGEKVRWQGADGIVIAYIHDHDLGDLWRGVWFEEGMESFDMEAEELIDARKKWERRVAKSSSTNTNNNTTASSSQANKQFGKNKNKDDPQQRRSHRFTSANELRINGVEYGIVLAASFSRGARPGVYWPARVMNASEANAIPGTKNKRGAPRQRLDLVFLAPYWNSRAADAVAPVGPGSRRAIESFSESLSRHGESLFNSGPLFDVESVDVSEDMIKEYPYDGRDGGISIDQLRVAFRFSGLPKAAFQRFLDSHRLAVALKTYAQDHLPPRGPDHASAGLFETHPMSVMAPIFPPEVLHLPYAYILSQLPAPPCEQIVHDGETRNKEPVLQLNVMIEAMKPPNCWGQGSPKIPNGAQSPSKKNTPMRVAESPFIDAGSLLRASSHDGAKPVEVEHFTKDLMALKQATAAGAIPSLEGMVQNLQKILSSVTPEFAVLNNDEKQARAKTLARSWMFAKANGEDAIGASIHANNSNAVLVEWRRACERIYKYMTHAFSASGYGNGVSYVLTDFRCNQHVTSCGCFERTVRLPAALKAARNVGAGKSDNVQLSTAVEKSYVEMAENQVLMKAHSASYLRRMKSRCSQIRGDQVVYLTEDSDGNGGEDTKGSRGSWIAAVASVGAAIKATDMVVEGQCVNAFIATRPPGHHAGRDLHPMKAVSNGFCLLNTAACAALHATTPLAEGGPGLRRVCVIDFDVHHGNGTQDILCSTYDPRFLYVSLHAGGAHVNGLPPSDDFDSEIHSPGGNSGKKGIYPGRCGDSSPHQGVLNIPLGPRVTSHAVGTALMNQVTPAVEAFSPDLIILSAGFDGHKNDPLGLGGLSAEDYGHITDVACQLASRCCSGRLISLLEGGYGVPCCRPQRILFLPPEKQDGQSQKAEVEQKERSPSEATTEQAGEKAPVQGTEKPKEYDQGPYGGVPQEKMPEKPVDQEKKDDSVQMPTPVVPADAEIPQPSKLLDLGEDLPPDMDDQVPFALQRRLEKCHAEGFIECVESHVKSLVKCNTRS